VARHHRWPCFRVCGVMDRLIVLRVQVACMAARRMKSSSGKRGDHQDVHMRAAVRRDRAGARPCCSWMRRRTTTTGREQQPELFTINARAATAVDRRCRPHADDLRFYGGHRPRLSQYVNLISHSRANNVCMPRATGGVSWEGEALGDPEAVARVYWACIAGCIRGERSRTTRTSC
jgi:hypothetical protein